MDPQTLDQLIRFSTDAYGLERTLRFFQALAQIISSFPAIFNLFFRALSSATTAKSLSAATVHRSLLGLRQRLGLGRRYFRLFRFLDAFHGAHTLYSSAYSSAAARKNSKSASWDQIELWLDISARAFNGMYLLLETATMLDALQVEGLSMWSTGTERMLNVEAQRFWLFALVCGIFSGFVKMLKVMAYTPVPTVGAAMTAEKDNDRSMDAEAEKEEKMTEAEKARFDVKKEQERLRAIVKNRRKGVAQWRGEVRRKIKLLVRSVVASALDLYLPGTYIGWISADPGTVGVLYLISTILTGLEVWERCGLEVAARRR